MVGEVVPRADETGYKKSQMRSGREKSSRHTPRPLDILPKMGC